MNQLDLVSLEHKINKSNQNEYLGKDKPVNVIKPLVSVCVTTYQQADYIGDCLNGILMQKTSFTFEVIVGEDDSSDGTREICKQYAEKHPDKIRLFLRCRDDVICFGGNPTGIFNAIANRTAARGKYIALCEGDDYWTDPYKLQKQVDYMEGNPGSTMCTHAADMVDIDGNLLEEMRPRIGSANFSVENIILEGGQIVATASCFIRSNVMVDLPYWFINSTSGDYALLLLCAYKGIVSYIDEHMAVYRRGAATSWYTMNIKNAEMMVKSRLDLIDMLDGFDSYSNGKYKSAILKRKRFYINFLLLMVLRNQVKMPDPLKTIIKQMPLKERINTYMPLLMPYSIKSIRRVTPGFIIELLRNVKKFIQRYRKSASMNR